MQDIFDDDDEFSMLDRQVHGGVYDTRSSDNNNNNDDEELRNLEQQHYSNNSHHQHQQQHKQKKSQKRKRKLSDLLDENNNNNEDSTPKPPVKFQVACMLSDDEKDDANELVSDYDDKNCELCRVGNIFTRDRSEQSAAYKNVVLLFENNYGKIDDVKLAHFVAEKYNLTCYKFDHGLLSSKHKLRAWTKELVLRHFRKHQINTKVMLQSKITFLDRSAEYLRKYGGVWNRVYLDGELQRHKELNFHNFELWKRVVKCQTDLIKLQNTIKKNEQVPGVGSGGSSNTGTDGVTIGPSSMDENEFNIGKVGGQSSTTQSKGLHSTKKASTMSELIF